MIPYTNYRVTVTACTDGGCTESSSVNIQTQQEGNIATVNLKLRKPDTLIEY